MSAFPPRRVPRGRRGSRALRLSAAAALGLLAAAAPGLAVPSPPTSPGWPRTVPAGTVLPGPTAGGVVVVSAAGTARAYITTALRRDGRTLWRDRRVPSCGNCDDGAQAVALQPDGTYGPVGFEGDDFWALDARGREVAGCSGAVAADGGCVFVRPSTQAGTASRPVFVARDAAGSEAWTLTDPSYSWYPELDEPPVVVRDQAGLLYAGLGPGTDVADGALRRGRLIAIDPVSRTIAWSRPDLYLSLTSLGSGVLAAGDTRVVALAADGSERWSWSHAAGLGVFPATSAYDAARGRVYVSGFAGPQVVALSASTGAVVWRTPVSARATLMSVGRGGRVYVAVGTPGRQAVRALRIADGSTAWERRTSLPVLGARELADGRVAVSAGQRFAQSKGDRLTVLDPR